MTASLPSRFLSYTLAVALVVLATLGRLLLDPILGDRAPFATVLVVVLFMAWYGGIGPACVTILLGSLAIAYSVLPPRGSLLIQRAEQRVSLGVFVLIGLGSSLLLASLRTARGRAEANAREAEERRQQVEHELRGRRQAEAELRQHREWLHATLASISDAVIATDTQGITTFLNPVAQALTGWKPDEARGQPLTAVCPLVHEATHQPIENLALRAVREGRVIELANHTLLLAHADKEHPIDGSAALIRNDEAAVVGVVLVFRDVGEKRRADQELRSSQERLRDQAAQLAEVDRRKDEFLATLAHELRNPLAPLLQGVEILRLRETQDATLNEVQGMMALQLQQLVRLVDDLLDVSRISTGKIELRKGPLDLAKVIEGAVETSRSLIQERKHALVLTLPSHLPRLTGDFARLMQVVANLLNNSAKFTPEGGRIGLTVEERPPHVVIRVRDNGVGIPVPMQAQVFEMFTQVDRNMERQSGGLGIGLTLVRRLVELHGGTVEAHSEGEGRGSEFIVRLPLPEEKANGTAAEPPQRLEPAVKLPARRILVVDDNRSAARSLGMILQMTGNEVEVAYDGPTALETAKAFRPDVVLLDLGMPGMNGYAVARALRQEAELAGTVLVAQTGWGQPQDRRRCEEAGFHFHLVKPVALDALQQLLANVGSAR